MPGTGVSMNCVKRLTVYSTVCARTPTSQLKWIEKEKETNEEKRRNEKKKKKKHVKCTINHFYANVTISRLLRGIDMCQTPQEPTKRNYRRRWRRRWRPNSFVSFTISQCNSWTNKNYSQRHSETETESQSAKEKKRNEQIARIFDDEVSNRKT